MDDVYERRRLAAECLMMHKIKPRLSAAPRLPSGTTKARWESGAPDGHRANASHLSSFRGCDFLSEPLSPGSSDQRRCNFLPAKQSNKALSGETRVPIAAGARSLPRPASIPPQNYRHASSWSPSFERAAQEQSPSGDSLMDARRPTGSRGLK